MHFVIFSECFPKNSFEQICINFVNEKIRQFSTNRLIKEEMDWYENDGIKIPQIDFLDNRNVIGNYWQCIEVEIDFLD